MNEPPRDPSFLSYATPERGRLPTGVQAFLGAVFTLVLIVGVVIVAGFLMAGANGKGMVKVILAVTGAIILMISLSIAIPLKQDPRRRGWAIGIYIGLGLGCLFWGYCGLLMLANPI